MTGIGLGHSSLPLDWKHYSSHLLAPTTLNLVKYSSEDITLAGFHTDLTFLTIHGRSLYPGLHIWAPSTRRRIPARIPPGSSLNASPVAL